MTLRTGSSGDTHRMVQSLRDMATPITPSVEGPPSTSPNRRAWTNNKRNGSQCTKRLDNRASNTLMLSWATSLRPLVYCSVMYNCRVSIGSNIGSESSIERSRCSHRRYSTPRYKFNRPVLPDRTTVLLTRRINNRRERGRSCKKTPLSR